MKTAKQLRAEWYDALESGEFEQGRGSLASRGSTERDWAYCCLGVACHLAVADGRLNVSGDDYEKSYGVGVDEDCHTSGLPSVRFMETLGFDTNDPFVEVDGKRRTVSSLNDSGAYTFAQIAELLRKEYPA